MSEAANISRPQYDLLHTVRGVCIISMVLYHAMYDVVSILGVSVPWFRSTAGYVWQQSICWTFIFLSGMCWQLSRRALKRGIFLMLCGSIVSLVTYIVMPSQLILFGVIFLLGLCGAALWALDKLLLSKVNIPPIAGLIVSLLLFFITRGVPEGYLGFEGIELLELPDFLYSSTLLSWLGFPPPDFFSTDYFPFIPWFFLYLAGYFLWSILKNSEKALSKLKFGLRPLTFLGKHSLLIYLAHQPVLMGIFMLL